MTITGERCAQRCRSKVNKLSEQRAAAGEDIDDNSERLKHQSNILMLNTDSQASGHQSVKSIARPEQEDEHPKLSAAITKNTLLALTQAVKSANPGSKAEIQPSSFNNECDLALFLKQFKDVAIQMVRWAYRRPALT